jgi:hypothetical protein
MQKNLLLILVLSSANLFGQISGFVPRKINGGMAQHLVISGNGFGAIRGSNYVSFFQESGQYNDAATAQAFKYVSWSDTKIEMEMPVAYSGKIKVKIAGNDLTSTDTLHVMANLGYRSANPLVYDYLVNTNQKGGYTWYMHRTYWENPLAKKAIEEVFAEFRCKTGVNYILAPQLTDVGFSLGDTFHIIAPDPALGAVGYNERLWISCILGSETFYSVKSQDLHMSDKQDWYFGTGKAPAGKTKFRYVLYHELGHSLGLGHVNELGQSMYPSVSLLPSDLWSQRDSITKEEQQTISYFVTLSQNFSFRACGVSPLLTVADCKNVYNTRTSIERVKQAIQISCYPNPVHDQLTVAQTLSTATHFSIYNLQGQLILQGTYNGTPISVSELPSGLYTLVMFDAHQPLQARFVKA